MVEICDNFDFAAAFADTRFVLIGHGDGRGTDIVTGWAELRSKVNEEAGIDLADPAYFDDWEWSDEKISEPYHIYFSFEDGSLTIARLPTEASLAAANAEIERLRARWQDERAAAVFKINHNIARAETAETSVATLTARVAELEAGLADTVRWAESRCPCRNDLPNPCPLCGASVENLEACKSAERIIPPRLLTNLRAILQKDKNHG